jgi:hypothetical protein
MIEIAQRVNRGGGCYMMAGIRVVEPVDQFQGCELDSLKRSSRRAERAANRMEC